jgi:hypothetical protein
MLGCVFKVFQAEWLNRVCFFLLRLDNNRRLEGGIFRFKEKVKLVVQLCEFVICLLMMNLLIGILSEKLAEVLDNRIRQDYAEMCAMILDLELPSFFNILSIRCSKKKKLTDKKHLIYVELEDRRKADWQGRTTATVKPIKHEITMAEYRLQEQMTMLNEHQNNKIKALQKEQDDKFAQLNYKLDLLLESKNTIIKPTIVIEPEKEKTNTIKPFSLKDLKNTSQHLLDSSVVVEKQEKQEKP